MQPLHAIAGIASDGFLHRIVGTQGDDTLTGSNHVERIEGLGGDDLIFGGGRFDQIFGGAGDDTIDGGDGDDQLFGGKGDDLVQGGAGSDEAAYFLGAKGAMTIDLGAGTASGEGVGHDTLVSIENASGGRFADLVTGDGQANELWGYAGDDLLAGGDGDDQLVADKGDDTLVGGSGADTMSGWHGLDSFVYLAASDSTVETSDLIALDKADTVDLSAIDADTTQDGDQAFHRVDHLSGHAGELALEFDPDGHTNLLADVDGDGQADMMVVMLGDMTGFHHFVL